MNDEILVRWVCGLAVSTSLLALLIGDRSRAVMKVRTQVLDWIPDCVIYPKSNEKAWEVYRRHDYPEMLLKFWKPVKSFYPEVFK